MKNKPILLIITALFILLPVRVFAQEPAFLLKLKNELKTQGLAHQQIELIMTEARNMNWELLDRDFSEITALSLALCQRSRVEMQTQEQLELAYHLTVLGEEMKSLGFKDRHIVRFTLNTTRDYIEAIRLRNRDRDRLQTRDLITERIRAGLGKEGLNEQMETLMQRLQVRVKNGLQQKNHDRVNGPRF